MQVVGERISFRLDPYIFLHLCLLAAIIFWQYGPLKQPILGDPGYFIYLGQEMARGRAPYSSTFDIKPPLVRLMGALAAIVGRTVGVDDVVAMRLASLVVGTLAVGFTYLVVARLLEHRGLGLVATLVMASFSFLAESAAVGSEPKVIMALMGLITLYSIQNRIWWLAGLAGSLAFLAWQPGAVYALLALAASLLLGDKERRSCFVRAFLGAVVPLGLLVLYLGYHGALDDAVRQCVIFPLSMVSKKAPTSLTSRLAHIVRVLYRAYGSEMWFIRLGVIGLLARFSYWGWTWARGTSSIKARQEAFFTLSWLALVFLSLVQYGQGPDFIPLLPYVATGVAWMVGVGTTWFSKSLSWLGRTGATLYAPRAFLGVALIWVVIYGMGDIHYPRRKPNLERQRAFVEEIVGALGPNDEVLAIGVPEILVLSGRENASKYIYFHGGVVDWIDAHEEGGFSAFLEDIQERKPKVVALARLPRRSIHMQGLLQWVEENYDLYFAKGKLRIGRRERYRYKQSRMKRIYVWSGDTTQFSE
jgi:hypothetical protein